MPTLVSYDVVLIPLDPRIVAIYYLASKVSYSQAGQVYMSALFNPELPDDIKRLQPFKVNIIERSA